MIELEQAVRDKYRQITCKLIEKHLSITTMESCTAGLLASLLTDTEGSSAVIKGAFVTYCNEAKVMQGVPASVLDGFGVYSVETAREMALAAKRAYGADISIGVTGTMDTANSDSTPGEVFFAIAYGDKTELFCLKIPCQETRFEYKLLVADAIADKLIDMLYYRLVI